MPYLTLHDRFFIFNFSVDTGMLCSEKYQEEALPFESSVITMAADVFFITTKPFVLIVCNAGISKLIVKLACEI